MEREALVTALDDGTEAATSARTAILTGGDYTVWEGTTCAKALAGVYERRLRRARRTGQRTLDLERAVRLLRHHGAPVRVGRVDAPDRSWVYLLFLVGDGTDLVACTGVKCRDR
ncbi:hypothetical protein [Streptomyces sp. NPDC054887]